MNWHVFLLPYGVELGILRKNDVQGVTPLEERYMKVSRRPAGRRQAPPQRRQTGPDRRRTEADDWDEPPRKRGRSGRSPAAAVAVGFYKVLVLVSALIVAAYLGFSFMIKAPEQKAPPPPVQAGNKTDSTGGSTSAAGSAAPTERQLRKGVYNIFLAATDLEGFRTDIMMVMSYDTVAQTVGVISVPRDTLVARESGNPHLVYGKGGLDQRVAEVSDMLGIPIDYYIKVNIKGFVTLVDYLGGVDFYIPCKMDYDDPIQNLHIHYTEGMRHLGGQEAMEVARFRKNNDGSGYTDTGRTETHQKLLVALAKKVQSWGSLTKINGFVEIFNKNVDTDLSVNDMLYFASQAVGLDPSSSIETGTLPGRGDGVYRGSRYCYVLDPEETLELVNRLVNPYDQPLTLDDMNLAKADSFTG